MGPERCELGNSSQNCINFVRSKLLASEQDVHSFILEMPCLIISNFVRSKWLAASERERSGEITDGRRGSTEWAFIFTV